MVNSMVAQNIQDAVQPGGISKRRTCYLNFIGVIIVDGEYRETLPYGLLIYVLIAIINYKRPQILRS